MKDWAPIFLLSLAFFFVVSFPSNKKDPSTAPASGSEIRQEVATEKHSSHEALMAIPGELEFLAAYSAYLRDLPENELPVLLEKLSALGVGARSDWRWAARARAMAEESFASRDAAELLRRTNPDFIPAGGRAQRLALRTQLQNSSDTAIRDFRRLLSNRTSLADIEELVGGFLEDLAAKDPDLAARELMAMGKTHPSIPGYAGGMMRDWSAKAPGPALDFATLHKNADPGRKLLKGAMAGALESHPDAFAGWLRSLPETDKSEAAILLFSDRQTMSPQTALAAAGIFGEPRVWVFCGAFWRNAGIKPAGMAALLGQAPPALKRQILAEYCFAEAGNPALKRDDLSGLSQYFEPEERIEFWLSLAEDPRWGDQPMSPELRNIIQTFDAGRFLARLQDKPGTRTLARMLASEPDEVFRWLEPGLGEKNIGIVASSWPKHRLAREARKFLSDPAPSRKAFGLALAKSWFEWDPEAAFPELAGRDPAWLADATRISRLAESMYGEKERMTVLFESLPGEQQELARANLVALQIRQHKPGDRLAGAWQTIEESGRDPDVIVKVLEPLVYDLDPGVDDMVLLLPPKHPKRAHLLKWRANMNWKKRNIREAIRFWQMTEDPKEVLSTIEVNADSMPVVHSEWVELLSYLAGFPAGYARNDAFEDVCEQLVLTSFGKTLAMARTAESPEAKEALLLALAKRTRTTEQLKELLPLVEGNDLPGMKSIAESLSMKRAQLDPLPILREMSKGRQDFSSARSMAIGSLVRQHPTQALLLVAEAPFHPLSKELLRRLLQELGASHPAEMFPLARFLCLTDRSFPDLTPLLRSWMSMDPIAAMRAIHHLPPGRAKNHLIHNGMSNWHATDPANCQKWLESMPNPRARRWAWNILANQVVNFDPDFASRFWLALEPEPGGGNRDNGTSIITSGLAKYSHEAAARFLFSTAEKLHRQNDGKAMPWKETIRPIWMGNVENWKKSDPESCQNFLSSLPDGEVGREFRSWGGGQALRPPEIDVPWQLEQARLAMKNAAEQNGIEGMLQRLEGVPAGLECDLLKIAAFELALRRSEETWMSQLLETEGKEKGLSAALESFLFPEDETNLESLAGKLEGLAGLTDERVLGQLPVVICKKWQTDPLRQADLLEYSSKFPAFRESDEILRFFRYRKEHKLLLCEARLARGGKISPVTESLKNANQALLEKDEIKALRALAVLPVPLYEELLAAQLARMPEDTVKSAMTGLPESAKKRLEALNECIAPLRPTRP